MITILVTFLLALFYMMVRNNTVFNARHKALKLTSRYAKKLLYSCIDFYDILGSYPSYNKMLWKLFTFSFEKLYPDLEKRLQNAI